MRISPLKHYIMIIGNEDPRGLIYTNEVREKALISLMEVTGQNFGYDTEKWKNWCQINKPDGYF